MKILSIIAVAAFAVTGIVRSADDKVVAPDKAPSQLEQQELKVGSPAQVSGKIVSLHKCTLSGMTDPHILVKLESAPGDVDVVDLGSAAELKSNGIEPREGQFFAVDGRVGTINGKHLVVAESLSESKIVFVTQQASLREETSTQNAEAINKDKGAEATEAKRVRDPNAPKTPKTLTVDADQQIRVIEGVVMHTRRVKIENDSNNEHTLAKVQTENGIVILDLGVCSAIPANVDLTEGKSIAASGFVGHLNERPVIIVESVGNLSSIQRPNAPAVAVPTSAPVPAK